MARPPKSRPGGWAALWQLIVHLWPLLLTVGLPLLVGLTYIVWLGRQVGGGKRLLVLHLATAACLLSLIVIGLALLSRLPLLRRGWPGRLMVGSVLSLFGAGLLALYIGNVISNLFWKDTLTFSLFRHFVLEMHILRDEVPVPGTWIYLTLAIVALLAVVPSFLLSGPVLATFDRLLSPAPDSPTTRRSSWRPLALIASSWIVFLAVLALMAIAWRPGFSLSSKSFESAQARFLARQILRQEPIVGLFNDTGVVSFDQYWSSLQSAPEEAAIRATYPKGRQSDRRNVVLIVSDALRPDHMQVYGYERPTTPFLEELRRAGELTRFEMALASCPSSPCGISSILSSRSLGSILPQRFALHELFYDQGYEVQFLLSGDHACCGLRQFYGDSITRLFDGTRSSSYAATDDRVVLEALEATDDFNGTPAFFFFHVMAPHVLAPRQPENRVFGSADSRTWVTTEEGDERSAHEAAVNFYDNGVLQADRIIARIFEDLRSKGYLDEALVIITSDHGEALGEKRPGMFRRKALDVPEAFYGHRRELYQEYVAIPLLIWEEGAAEYPDLDFARQIDIAPTIVDRLGLPIPSSWQGRSLLRAAGTRQALMDAHFPTEPAYALAVFSEQSIYKYIRYSTPFFGPFEELYELRSDPGESRNLIDQADPSLIDDLRKRLATALGAEG